MQQVGSYCQIAARRNPWEDCFYAERHGKCFEAILWAHKCKSRSLKLESLDLFTENGHPSRLYKYWVWFNFSEEDASGMSRQGAWGFIAGFNGGNICCFQAVRIGDLELFKSIAEKFSSTFNADRTLNLIVRLRHNVIRTGLRNISISYSRISLADVAKKLRLDSANPVAEAESIVAKAIRDGAIDATLDHANGWMVSKETGDIYSTNEPQIAFNSRIAFCLNMHNEAVRALRFPPNSHKEKESAEKRRERQQQEQELAKHIAEEDDDEFWFSICEGACQFIMELSPPALCLYNLNSMAGI